MTNEELKCALLDKSPVILTLSDGFTAEYERITGIVYREKNGHILISAEVLDKCGHSVIYCDPKRLALKGGAADV